MTRPSGHSFRENYPTKTQREHTPFALVERSLVRQKIPEALGAICPPGKANDSEDHFDLLENINLCPVPIVFF